MTLPSKKQQVAAVAKFLDSDRNEGRSLDEIASDIVDGYLDAITPPAPPPTLRVGMLIKTLASNKAHRVAWISGERVWIVPEAGGYGWLGELNNDIWGFSEEYRPKRRIDGKMVEMTDEMIAEAWANPDWKVGDRLSQHQREFKFEVIATGPKCVLMVQDNGKLQADSNTNLEKYYRRELKGGSEW
jgi:hypothetical protein